MMRCAYCGLFCIGLAVMGALVWLNHDSAGVATAGQPAPVQPVVPVAAEAPKPAAGNADADAWGTIKGQLVYGGPNVPEQKELKANKDEQHCLAKGPILDHEWIVNKQNKGVKNVFVWLAADPNEPYASVMREGQALIVKNTAPVAHNANHIGSPLKNPAGNPIVPAGGQVTIPLKADRFPVRLSCNIHPWMKGFVGVYDHPYYALTDANGNFEIKHAPAGAFRMFIWHEAVGWRLGTEGAKGEPVTIRAKETTDLGKLPIQEAK
jgi:hypothetical protein